MNELTNPWDAVARLQNKLSQHYCADRRGRALEAQIDYVLSTYDPPTEEGLQRTQETVYRRERHRAILEAINLHELEPISRDTEAMDARVMLASIKNKLPPHDWALLLMIGQGYDYKHIAPSLNANEGQLRTRVMRLRQQLHTSF